MIIDHTDRQSIIGTLKELWNRPEVVRRLTVEVDDDFKIMPAKVTQFLSEWPAAVDPELIASPNSETDKLSRAEAIVSQFIKDDITGKKVLDFGCGEGHLAFQMSKQASVWAYDVNASWHNFDGVHFCKTLDEVRSAAPFDYIIMFDVLDHVMEDQVEVLKFCREVLGGKMLARNHPWCSRHGTHLFHTINKAFIHLIMSDDDLQWFGHKGLPARKVIHPLYEYKNLYTAAGLNIQSYSTKEDPVEDFFRNNFYKEIIGHWSQSAIDPELRAGRGWCGYALGHSFCDYVLTK